MAIGIVNTTDNASSTTVTMNDIKSGRAYSVSTPIINLTNATETPVLYIDNTGSNDISITSLVAIGKVSDQFGTFSVTVYRDVTAGTITSGTAITPRNLNTGSVSTLTADCRTGGTGTTFTATAPVTTFHRYSAQFNGGGEDVMEFSEAIYLPAGENIVIAFSAPASNTIFGASCRLVLKEEA